VFHAARGCVRTPGIYTALQIEAWRRVTDAVHAEGGKIFLQIFHTGRIALPDFLPGGAPPVSASNVRAKGRNYTDADAVAYGTLFLANPDLPARFAKNAELNAPDRATFYTPGEEGYTDYPSLEPAAGAAKIAGGSGL
jgi:2,4-dienoyl-CoA reductase-like NADH-dependent reductase (Old Yellow Enzyme family)